MNSVRSFVVELVEVVIVFLLLGTVLLFGLEAFKDVHPVPALVCWVAYKLMMFVIRQSNNKSRR